MDSWNGTQTVFDVLISTLASAFKFKCLRERMFNSLVRLSVCLAAVLRMTSAIEIQSSREFQVTSGFKRKHSEAEGASQRTKSIISYIYI